VGGLECFLSSRLLVVVVVVVGWVRFSVARSLGRAGLWNRFLGGKGKRRETERREGEMAARVGGRLLFLKQQQYGKLLYSNNKSCSSPLVVSVAAPLFHSVLESQEESIPAGLLRAASQLSQGRYHQFLLCQVYEEGEESVGIFSFFLSFFSGFRVFVFLRFTKSLRRCTTN
jgi:hypothetical protein